MKKIVFILFILLFVASSNAQMYEKQVGLRLGVTSGISGKIIKNDRTAIEGILGFRDGGIQIIGLAESYHPLIKTNTTHWMIYFGGGAHLGYINGYNRVRRWSNTSGYYYEEQRVAGMVLGVDAVIGTDYTFNRIPITLSLEFKPYLELQDFRTFDVNFWDVGFGIKYSFKNR
jgi:hypothetical protein